jgi:polyisoprenyl-phosphate glycosyltransferase
MEPNTDRQVWAPEVRPDPTIPQIRVLIPVYNDWHACSSVLARLDHELHAVGRQVDVLIVDDGSTVTPEAFGSDVQLSAIRRIEVLRLRRNMGHQRAICIGLSHLHDLSCDAVVVMDGDGEDDPKDVPRLLRRWDQDRGLTVFAERARRSEGFVFKLAYWSYRVSHRVLTGVSVRVGNFSVLPFRHLRSLVVTSELWSHYAAAVFISRLPYTTIPTTRGQRIAGKSTMNFVSLVTHGLSAISVFSEVVGVRVLLASASIAAATSAAIVTVLAIRLLTPMAIPGWATYTSGILLIVLLVTIMFAFLFSFSILFARKSTAVLPVRDYSLFVDSVTTVESAETDGGMG